MTFPDKHRSGSFISPTHPSGTSVRFQPPLACYRRLEKDAKMRPLTGRAPADCTFPESVSSGINNSLACMREEPFGQFHKPVLVLGPLLEDTCIQISTERKPPSPFTTHTLKGNFPDSPPKGRVLGPHLKGHGSLRSLCSPHRKSKKFPVIHSYDDFQALLTLQSETVIHSGNLNVY